MQLPPDLNASTRADRLDALRRHVAADTDGIRSVSFTDEVNNHVHTIYSFSPYSPTAAAWMARAAGLRAVGSVDHDSIAAAPETVEACRLLGIGSTVGCELRVNFTGTALEGRRLNSPDSENLAYIVFHGVPAPAVEAVDRFIAPIRERRNERNRAQTLAMSRLLVKVGAPEVSWEQVESCSLAAEGGSITERHLLFAASGALVERYGRGRTLREAVESRLCGELTAPVRDRLDDESNPHYRYDLLGALKGSFLPRFFIQPTEEECIPVGEAVQFATSVGAIPAYAYLGDVDESPTGDKAAAKFEDDYLDELFDELVRLGFQAVTYMPPRNTKAQLLRVQRLCAEHGLMEISGVDINSSRQRFTCPEILDPAFRHLIDSTWALIAHEKLASLDPSRALFAPDNPVTGTLAARLARYAGIGRRIDPENPAAALAVADA